VVEEDRALKGVTYVLRSVLDEKLDEFWLICPGLIVLIGKMRRSRKGVTQRSGR
jgi:hypothetical protein